VGESRIMVLPREAWGRHAWWRSHHAWRTSINLARRDPRLNLCAAQMSSAVRAANPKGACNRILSMRGCEARAASWAQEGAISCGALAKFGHFGGLDVGECHEDILAEIVPNVPLRHGEPRVFAQRVGLGETHVPVRCTFAQTSQHDLQIRELIQHPAEDQLLCVPGGIPRSTCHHTGCPASTIRCIAKARR